jgi:hypothetical protein
MLLILISLPPKAVPQIASAYYAREPNLNNYSNSYDGRRASNHIISPGAHQMKLANHNNTHLLHDCQQ